MQKPSALTMLINAYRSEDFRYRNLPQPRVPREIPRLTSAQDPSASDLLFYFASIKDYARFCGRFVFIRPTVDCRQNFNEKSLPATFRWRSREHCSTVSTTKQTSDLKHHGPRTRREQTREICTIKIISRLITASYRLKGLCKRR